MWTSRERLVAAGDIVGMRVIDHLILADTHYCSMLGPKGL